MSLVWARPTFNPALSASLLLAASLSAAALAPVKKPLEPQVLHTPTGLTEVGVLDGAEYRIDIPTNWNHSLVVFFHGYAEHPYTYRSADRLSGQQLPFFDRHYAVIQSGYSRTGWAVQQAYPESESLRRYFIKKYGEPRESYVAGGSLGGVLVSITLELNPRPYLGGLDICGSVGPTFQSFEWRFAMRAAFDVYFPGVMPPLVPVPADFDDNAADRDRVLAALRANPSAAALMRNLTGLHSDSDLAHNITYWTFVVQDMQQRAGGNPFDNRNYLYTGTSTSSATDFDLNDRVHRYAAAPHAFEYLFHHYSPSGRLQRPMLAIHTIYDPTVPAGSLPLYDHLVQAAGFGDNLAQQYVDHEGHCNFSQDELGAAFDELVRWTHGGPRPAPGLLKETRAF
jgi:hypothetical protein